MKAFVEFLLTKVFLKPDELFLDENIIDKALQTTIRDVQYHYPSVTALEVKNRIQSNQNELVIFLYRFGREIFLTNSKSPSLNIIAWLMKEMCSCEIYYSNQIGEGFYVIHGEGTVIGSRNTIGNGFRIYQNCTIGHKQNLGKGCIFGDNVTMYAGSKVIGELNIGSKCVIGANTLVTKDIEAGNLAYGSPLIVKPVI